MGSRSTYRLWKSLRTIAVNRIRLFQEINLSPCQHIYNSTIQTQSVDGTFNFDHKYIKMQFLIDYGLFLAKTVTYLAAFAAIVGIVSSFSSRRQTTITERVDVLRVNDRYKKMGDAIEVAMLDKRGRKKKKKAARKTQKEDKKKSKNNNLSSQPCTLREVLGSCSL